VGKRSRKVASFRGRDREKNAEKNVGKKKKSQKLADCVCCLSAWLDYRLVIRPQGLKAREVLNCGRKLGWWMH